MMFTDNDSQTSKLMGLCALLPDCCSSFLLETGTQTAKSTRLAYARELIWFFDYLISYNPDFCDLDKPEITLEDIRKITSQDISRYLTIYKDKGKAERTVARKRAALSSFFEYLTVNRQIDHNPVSAAVRVKIHQSDEVLYLNIDEQLSLLSSVDNGASLDDKKRVYHDRYRVRDYSLVLLLLDTGMRVSELNGINIADMDLDGCSVIVTRKGGNRQTLYFSDETRDSVQEYLDERKVRGDALTGTEPLFVTLKGNRLTVRAIEKLVKKYTASAIPGKGQLLSPHKMRSSFAMEDYRAEKDILALQRKMGHKSLAATNIYAKATDQEMQATRSILSERRAMAKEKAEG